MTEDTIDLTTRVRWDDMRAPASLINPAGSIAPPSISTDDGSLVFSKGKAVAIWFQFPHGWLEGSDIIPHIHFSKTTVGVGYPNFKIKYKWANIGDVFPAFNTLIPGTLEVSDDNTINKNALISFGHIPSIGKKISSMICVYLERVNDTSDTYAGDIKLYELDIHYQVDAFGSIQEFIKEG